MSIPPPMQWQTPPNTVLPAETHIAAVTVVPQAVTVKCSSQGWQPYAEPHQGRYCLARGAPQPTCSTDVPSNRVAPFSPCCTTDERKEGGGKDGPKHSVTCHHCRNGASSCPYSQCCSRLPPHTRVTTPRVLPPHGLITRTLHRDKQCRSDPNCTMHHRGIYNWRSGRQHRFVMPAKIGKLVQLSPV
jgi:hypothetical protein